MTLSKIYRWRRFWTEREGTFDLSDGGYLRNPEDDNPPFKTSDSKPFEAIENVQCLALLGEPGIGKTQWSELERETITARILGSGDDALWLDMSLYGEASDLIRNITETKEFKNWEKGEHKLHLFLDALDECCLRIVNLPKRLIQEFGKYSIERLYPRIFCRTADWPQGFEQRLKKTWGNKHFNAYELNPLRRIDVQEMAESEISDPEIFLSQIESKGLVPFAIKPQTLNFLIATYNKNSGKFPTNTVDLYLDGCSALCDEPNPDRRDAKIWKSSSEDRLAIACRIATLMVFGNRAAIWRGQDSEAPANDILLKEINFGFEKVSGRELPVTVEVIDETLQTALFTSRGFNRMGWAHQAYSGFLAAHYLWQHDLPLPQILNLIVHARSHHGKIKPQLKEVAGWLAAMRPDVYDYIFDHDPEILVDCVADVRSQYERKKLVSRILLQSEEEMPGSQRSLSSQGYRKLCHAALADQLLPFIKDRNKNLQARIRAIAIADHCNVTEVLSTLVELALDSSEELEIRELAVFVVASSDNRALKARFKALLAGVVEEDPFDELKGGALTAVWPDDIAAKELFEALTVPEAGEPFRRPIQCSSSQPYRSPFAC